MIGEEQMVARVARLEIETLRIWVSNGWLSPSDGPTGPGYEEADVARSELICDLCYDMGVCEESVPIILSLIDQVHDTRRILRALLDTLEQQPEEVRTRVHETVRGKLGRQP
jgi:chaperone modulatory protein CbpM